VGLDDVLDEGQAQAGALDGACLGSGAVHELPEHLALLLSGDADALVAHADDESPVLDLPGHPDGLAPRGILQRVVQQIPQRAFQGGRIGSDHRRSAAPSQVNPIAAVPHLRLELGDNLLHQVFRRYRLQDELVRASVHPPEVEQILHQSGEALGPAPQRPVILVTVLLTRLPPVRQEVRELAEGCQWRAEFVGDRRDEIGLQPRRLELAGHGSGTEVAAGRRQQGHQTQPTQEQATTAGQLGRRRRGVRIDDAERPGQTGARHCAQDVRALRLGDLREHGAPLGIVERHADPLALEQLLQRTHELAFDKAGAAHQRDEPIGGTAPEHEHRPVVRPHAPAAGERLLLPVPVLLPSFPERFHADGQ
jgi:hypothetical protein